MDRNSPETPPTVLAVISVTAPATGTYTVLAGEHFGYQTGGYWINGTNPDWLSAPIANFTANVTSGTAPLAVQFTDTSSGSPTEWNWDFGEGNVQH